MAPITEERASRTLYRISLLRRLRERVLPHPSMEESLLLAPLSSELPVWWSTPAHDRELMLGAALHGVSRTELSVFSDPQFSFSQARHDYLEIQQNQPAPATPLRQPQAEEGSAVKEEEGLNEESVLLGASEALGHSDTQITPLSRPDGKGRARTGLGWKKSRGRGPRSGGSKGERSVGGISDSDSDSDSGSSTSSQRSGSSDDSGDSDTERERGECGLSDIEV